MKNSEYNKNQWPLASYGRNILLILSGSCFQKGYKILLETVECSSEVNFELKPILKLGKDHFSHKICNFNPYIIINIAFRDFPLQQYDNLNDTHSKLTLKIN